MDNFGRRVLLRGVIDISLPCSTIWHTSSLSLHHKINLWYMNDKHLINIIGIGHNGCHVASLIRKKHRDVSFTICDTYEESLNGLSAERKILLKKGGDIIDRQSINRILGGGEYITLLVAHMDNNISIQGICKIAKALKEAGRLTVAIISMPSQIEGEETTGRAQNGYEELRIVADTIFTTERPYNTMTIEEYFEAVENTLEEYTVCISEMITIPNLICFAWNDFKTMMKDTGEAFFAIGSGEGTHRVKSAIDNVVARIRENGHDIYKARRIIIFIIYRKINDEKMREELDGLNDFLKGYEHQPEIKWGLLTDETLDEKIKIEIIGSEKPYY